MAAKFKQRIIEQKDLHGEFVAILEMAMDKYNELLKSIPPGDFFQESFNGLETMLLVPLNQARTEYNNCCDMLAKSDHLPLDNGTQPKPELPGSK